jgi:hypothetical protein
MRRATHHCFSKKCFESIGIPGAEDPLLQDRPTRRSPLNINPATTYRNSRSDEDGYPNGCFFHVPGIAVHRTAALTTFSSNRSESKDFSSY